jgi:glycine betaine/proline transport system substrate-binding protein
MMLPTPKSLVLAAVLALAAAAPVAAADGPSCKVVRLADVGWSDIAVANGLVAVVLEALGYQPTVTAASLPVALTGMKNRQIDVFLGYWKPAMTSVVEPFVRDGDIQVLEVPNLAGARYTLAVPRHLYDRGLKDFADIVRFEKELEGRIHGIEPGSEANAQIQAMIRDNRFGLKNFTLVASSEAAMLGQVQQASRSRKAIVFVGWEPHPMNVQLRMNYLGGGDAVFGPDQGAAQVHTALARGYREKCPNVAALMSGLRFNAEMHSRVMVPILEKKGRPHAAARAYLQKNPSVAEPWLAGVTTIDGQDARAALAAALKP